MIISPSLSLSLPTLGSMEPSNQKSAPLLSRFGLVLMPTGAEEEERREERVDLPKDTNLESLVP